MKSKREKKKKKEMKQTKKFLISRTNTHIHNSCDQSERSDGLHTYNILHT